MVERTSFFYICISVLSFTGCVPDGGGDSDEDATVMRRDASADELAPDGAFPDLGRVGPPVAADCAPSGDERCNDTDDDCDGEVDEGFDTGGVCIVGRGACEATGTWICAEGGGTTCSATAGAPVDERCNTIDDDTGQVANGVHEANGVGWYYSDQYSWGFAPAGAPVNRNSCDVEGQADETRMCWHTGGGNLNFGWRCGSNTGAGANTERFVFAADRLGSRLVCTAEPGDAAAEICNGLDDDCDGAADEGLACP